jgi:hypothetical protein
MAALQNNAMMERKREEMQPRGYPFAEGFAESADDRWSGRVGAKAIGSDMLRCVYRVMFLQITFRRSCSLDDQTLNSSQHVIKQN